MRRALVAILLSLLSPLALGATYYVSNVGHDTECSGTSNASWNPVGGGGQTCAFKTPTKAYTTSSCGDTIRLIGSVYDERLSLSKTCTAGTVLTITSDTGTAVWHVGQVDVTGCTLSSGSSYTCPIPSGGVTAGTSREDCFGQSLTSGVAWSDENGVDATLSRFACMTEHTTTGTVDTTPGSWVVSGSNYYVHLWNDESPASGSGKIFAPTTGAGSNQSCLTHTGAYHTVDNVDIVSGCELGVHDLGDHLTMQDVDHYGGTLWSSGTNATFRRVVSLNQLRRPLNGTGTTLTAWDVSAGNQTWVNTGASNFSIEDSEATNAREAFSFSGNTGPGTVDGFKSHAMFNHGFKLIDTAHDIDFSNVVSWNNQEAMFLGDCVENITFQHCTFPEQPIMIHDNSADPCTNHTPDGPLNIDFHDNVIFSVIWLPTFGDARSGARGHDFDYNVYMDDVNPGNGAQAGAWQYHSPTSSQIKTLTGWQTWASDTCTDCTRGPNSVEATSMESVFITWAARSDTLIDWHLESGALAVNLSNALYDTPRGTDIDVETRDANEDAGADEYTGTAAVCGDGTDNDGDGATDYPADYGCTSAADTSEVGTTQCGDGVDNDSDGSIDQNDPDCTGAADDSEAAGGSGPSAAGSKMHNLKAVNVKMK